MTIRFDWLRFCTTHRIFFVTVGPNTARGHISVKCPWCGSADPSEHLGLSLDVGHPVWGCLRNSKHRGLNPTRLVAKLLHLPYSAAMDLVDKAAPPVDDFDVAVERLRGDVVEQSKEKKWSRVVQLPDMFRRLFNGSYGKRFVDYLTHRGFHDALGVAHQYDLFYCLTGDFAWRLIFPVVDNGVLIGWTGRDIRGGAKLRYRASDGLGKDVLMSFSTPASVVMIVEGPVDALKIDYYGQPFGVSGIATMGTAVTEKQKRLIGKIARNTPTCILFDAGAEAQSLSLADEVGARWLPLPFGFKDPGEMDGKTISKFLSKVVK